jgi:hypothetical protein
MNGLLLRLLPKYCVSSFLQRQEQKVALIGCTFAASATEEKKILLFGGDFSSLEPSAWK